MASFGFADIAAEENAYRQNEQRRVSSGAFRSMANPELAANIAATAQNYPNLPAAVIVAGTIAGVPADDDQWKLIEQEQVKQREEKWANSGFAPLDYLLDVAEGTWGIAKSSVRGGMVTFDTLWEEALPRHTRAQVLAYQGSDSVISGLPFGTNWNAAGASTGFRAASTFMGDPAGNIGSSLAHYANLFLPFGDPFEISTESRVNIGSGFFARSDLVSSDSDSVQNLVRQKGYSEQEALILASEEEFGSPSSALWRQGAESVHVTGTNGIQVGVSPGRLGALALGSEPGSTPFNWISGSMDFGAQVFLDPANLLTGGLSKARLAARGLDAATQARKGFGLVDNVRKTVFKTDAEKAWSSSRGLGFAQAMTDSTDYQFIHQALGGSARGRAPSRALVQQLRESKDLTRTRDILVNASGTEIVTKPWNTSVTGSLLGLDSTVRGALYGKISDVNGLKARKLLLVDQQVDNITNKLMPDYGGYRPRMRQRLESNFLYQGGELRRNAGSRNGRAASRLFAKMAGNHINVSDLDKGMAEIVQMGRAIDATPQDMEKALERWVNLTEGGAGFGQALYTVEGLMKPFRQRLIAKGVKADVANELTAVYKNIDMMQRYFVDRAGNIEDPGVFTMLLGNGEEVAVPLAHTLAESSMNMIPVPGRDGGRTLRRMTDFLYRSEGVLSEAGKVKGSMWYDDKFQSRVQVRAADSFMGLWRNAVLLRPAWTLRVVGEEQVRLAAAGLHVINNPIKGFMLALGDKNLKLGMQSRRKLLSSDLFENSLEYSSEWQAAMSRRGGGWFDSPGGYGAETWKKVSQTDADFNRWWSREIGQMQADPIATKLADAITDPNNPMTVDDVKLAFREGDLAHVREELALAGTTARHRALQTDEGADAYIDSLFARMHLKSGGEYRTLRDDGWWYNDSGERIEEAGFADQAILRQASEWGPQTKPGGKVRINARTHSEIHDNWIRSGMTDEHVERKMRILKAETGGDDRVLQQLDGDFRTVLIDAENLRETDIIADARVIKYEVTRNGNEEILRSMATGELRGVSFDGMSSASMEKELEKALGDMRLGEEGVIAPAFVKGVEDSANSGLYNNVVDTMFSTFMGKPTNRYSRSPAFTRAYWDAVDDLVDQGVVDDRTADTIRNMFKDKTGSPIQSSVRRSARDRGERMQQQMKDTERLMLFYEREFAGMTGPAAEVVEDVVKRLDALLKDDAYDVMEFGRTFERARIDLNEIDKALDEGIQAASKAENLDEADRLEIIKNLEAKRAELIGHVDRYDAFADDVLDEASAAERRAMDEMSVDEYIGGLDPATSEAMSNRPTDMEGLIQRRMDELEQQGPITKRTVGQRPEGPGEGLITGERPIVLERVSELAEDGKKGEWSASKYADKAEEYATDLQIPIQWRKLKAKSANEFRVNEVHIGTTPGRGTTGEYKIVFTRTPEGPLKTEVMHKVKGRWKKSNQKELDKWAQTQKRTTRTTRVTEYEEVIPAEAARGPEWDQYADEVGEVEPQVIHITADERHTALNDLGVTEDQLRDARQIPAIKEQAAKRIRMDKSEVEIFDEMLAERPRQLLSVAEVDRMAKATALTATQDLLYDLSNKSAVSDMMRNIFPFAEAWWEIISTWSRLIQANPKTLEMFQKAYFGATEDARPYDWTDPETGEQHQGALPGAELQVEGYDGSGFFYVDPNTEQEMFALPYFSQILSGNAVAGAGVGGAVGAGLGGFFAGAGGAGATGAVIGGIAGAVAGVGASQAGLVPEGESVDFGFSAQGLNMAAQSPIPGMGPLAAVPMSFVLNFAGEDWKPINDLMLPFGDPDIETPGDFINSVIPSQYRQFMTGTGIMADSDMLRIRANTTMEVAAMMVRQGTGSFNTQEEMRKTLDAASKKAGWLYAVRGIAAASAPSASQFKFSTEDYNGTWWATRTMANEWNRIKEANSGDPVSTFDEFVGLYGINPTTFMKGKTDTIRPTALTEQGYSWEKQHEPMFKEFPNTAYFVNPDDPMDDSFDYSAYLESLKDGSRVALTPEQWAMKSNQLAANIIMERFRRSGEAFLHANGDGKANTYQVQEQLYKLRGQLIRDHAGYGLQIAGTVSKMSLDEQLMEFNRWTPDMLATEAGKGLTLYLAARENAVAVSRDRGHSREWWKTSSDWEAVQLRQELKAIAAATYMKYPTFQALYVDVFARELEEQA